MERPFISAVIAAAGNATRMGRPKMLIEIGGQPVLRHTLCAFDGRVDEIIVVAREADHAAFAKLFAGLVTPCRLVVGGKTRQQSAANGLAAVTDRTVTDRAVTDRAVDHPEQIIAIADGARPLVSGEEIERVLCAAIETGAAACAVPVADTVKRADESGRVTGTLSRDGLWLVQTPQAFSLPLYRRAMEEAAAQGLDFTDDCQLFEHMGLPVTLVEGSRSNIKLTTPGDVAFARAVLCEREEIGVRVGHGYDVHRLVSGRELILGGVHIPHETGLLGHSDADVLLHAVTDALFGAAGLGDIGRWFPDTDERYRGADSLELLRQAVARVREAGFAVGNVDCTVVAQRPKLAAYLPGMRAHIASACGVSESRVNVKATTEERLGFTGSEEGIAAHAVCLLTGGV